MDGHKGRCVDLNLTTTLIKNVTYVHINGVKTSALVDTGASVSVISAKFFTKLGHNDTVLQTADYSFVNGVGGQLKVLGKIKLPVSFKGLVINIQVHVVDRLPHSLILGLDFMQTNKVHLHLDTNTMTIHNDHTKVNLLQTGSGLARVKDTVTLQPYMEYNIPVKISKRDTGDEVLLEPVPEIHKFHIMAAKCLVKVTKGLAYFRVLNPTNQSIVIHRNKVLATVSDIDPHCVLNLDDPVDIPDINTMTSSNTANSKAIHFDLSNSDLTNAQKHTLAAFLQQNRDVFATGLHELGQCNKYMHKIETLPNAKPVKMPFYRATPQHQSEINRQVDDLLQNDIIQESNSEWHSPCLLVKKSNGDFRLVTDFRRLNKITKPMSFPLPRMECVFDTIGQSRAKYFSSLDLHSAFLQIGMHPDSRHKAAFITQNGIYEYKRMPFGLMNAPVSFQMVMSQVLRGMTWKQCLIYLDDILVFSESFEAHIKHLDQIFAKLREANLKLKPDKCDFAAKELHYLGHIISKNGIRTNPKKTEAVSTFPVPKSQKDVRSFLGMCNYYRKFVKDYAKIAAPMNYLLRSDVQFQWTDQCQRSFEVLKQALLSSPILAYPDMNKSFILTCDASTTAIGYVLGQFDDEGKEHVIAYGGRSLHDNEKNWCTSEQEMLAIIEGIRSYHIYLADREFKIITDHKALKYVMNQKKTTSRLARWATEIQGYKFEVIHRPGKNNVVADALSRRSYDSPAASKENICSIDATESVQDCTSVVTNSSKSVNQEFVQVELFYSDLPTIYAVDPESVLPSLSDLPSIAKLQQECEDFKDIYQYLDQDILPNDEDQILKIVVNSRYYELCDGVLYHWFQRRVKRNKDAPVEERWVKQLALPKVLRQEALKAYHDNSAGGAHLGIERVMAAMKSKYHWPRMHQAIHDYIHHCDTCQRIKRDTHAHPPPLTPLPTDGRFERWHMDFLKLHKTKDGYQYVLVIVDSFTKWIEAFPMKTQESTEVATCLFENVFTRFGCPKYLVSDRGRSFMNNLITALCELFDIKQFLTSSYHPQSNSQVERTNSTIIQCLRAYCSKDQNTWPVKLPGILMALRRSPCTQSTEFSPFYMVFGIEMNLPFDTNVVPKDKLGKNAKHYIEEVLENLKITQDIATQNINDRKQKAKQRYDQHSKEPKFRIFDKVLLKVHQVPVGLSPKLVEKYEGPYYISEMGPNYTYKIRSCTNRKEHKSLVNASELKHYHDPNILSQQNNDNSLANSQMSTQSNTQGSYADTGNASGTSVDNTPNIAQSSNTSSDQSHDSTVNTSQTNNSTNDNKSQGQSTSHQRSYPYTVKKILKYRHKDQYFRIEWSDGSRSWEPQENLHPSLVEQYFRRYNKQGRLRKSRSKCFR